MSRDTPARPPGHAGDADLSGAFNNPRRSQALRGKLTPRSAPAPATTAAPAAEDPVGHASAELAVPPVPVAVPEPSTATATGPTPRRSAESSGGKVTRAVYVPASLRTKMQDRRRITGRSYSVTVMDALDATHERLPQILGIEEQTSSLFERPTSPARPPAEGGGVQLTLTFTAANDAVINSLIAKTLGDVERNRTRFITAALTAFFDQISD